MQKSMPYISARSSRRFWGGSSTLTRRSSIFFLRSSISTLALSKHLFASMTDFPATTFSPTFPFDGISHRRRKKSPMTITIPIMMEEASKVIPYRTAFSIPMVRNEEASSGDNSMVLNSGFSDCNSTLVCSQEPSSFCSFSLWYFLIVKLHP